MKQQRKLIDTTPIVVFDSDVSPSDLRLFPKEFLGDIVINGDLYLDDNIELSCKHLYANSIISYGVNCNITGNVMCQKRIDAHNLKVDGNIIAEDIESLCTISTGDIICETITCDAIKVLSELKAFQYVDARGGTVHVHSLALIKPARIYNVQKFKIGY